MLPSMLTQWNLDNVLRRPPETVSVFDTTFRETKVSVPLGKRLSLTFVGKVYVAALIVTLLCVSCPPAVFWCIVSIIVFPIKRAAIGTRTHIGYKGYRRIQPLRTHPDTAATIMSEAVMCSVSAACNHGTPRFVCRSFRQTMCELLVSTGLTPARSCMTATQITGKCA